jgi:hypothetical protein
MLLRRLEGLRYWLEWCAWAGKVGYVLQGDFLHCIALGMEAWHHIMGLHGKIMVVHLVME